MAPDSKHNDQQHSLQQNALQQGHATDVTQSEASLLDLPVEILEMIVTELDNNGLKSMRATCRTLCNGSTKEFYRRHTSSEVQILATRDTFNMRKLTVTLRSPSLTKAQATMARLLVLHDPLYAEDANDPEGPIKASHSTTSNPDAFTLLQVKNYRQWHGYGLAPLIFERVADQPPQTTNLRRITIEGAHLDGDALIDILETHKHFLRCVTLRKVVLTDFIECVQALCRTETQRFEFEGFKIGERVGKEVYTTYFTRRHDAFPEFMLTMRGWNLLSGWGSSTSTWERQGDIG